MKKYCSCSELYDFHNLDDEDTAGRIIKKYFNDNYGTICASQNHGILDTMKELFESQMWKDFKEATKNIIHCRIRLHAFTFHDCK